MKQEDAGTSRKLGEQIARTIAGLIGSGELPIGARIGTEEDLSAQYRVSRWIMREAVAVLEMDGLVESRRGASGGLYVSAPAASQRAATLRHYFSLAGATASEINHTRAIIESQVIERAMRRLTVADAERLRGFRLRPEGSAPEALARNTNALLREMLRLADHPALTIFSISLAQANIDRALWNGAPLSIIQRLSEQTWEMRVRQVEAVIASDETGALACQEEIAAAGDALLAGFCDPPRDIPTALVRAASLGRGDYVSGSARAAKKPEAVARLVAQRIIERDANADEHLGSESELLGTLDISRNVLREAVRLLERYGIATVRRGQSGGLRAIRRDPGTIARATSLYLAPFYARSQGSFHRISRSLQLEAASQTAAHGQAEDPLFAEDLAAYRSELAGPRQSVRAEIFRFYDFLARACRNPVIECFMRTLVMPVEFAEPVLSDDRLSELRAFQCRLADALAAGDAPLARRLALALRDIGVQLGPRPRGVAELVAVD